MALPSFAKKDEIPKGFEDEYEERDGKWVFTGLEKTAAQLADEKDKRKVAEKAAQKAADALRESEAKAEASKAGVTDEVLKKIRDDAEKAAGEKYKPIVTEAETLKAENRTLKLDNVVKGMLADAHFLPERLDDAMRLHGAEFDLTADGKPMVKAEPAKDIKKHIAAIAKARPEWVAGTRAAGGGAAGVTTAAEGTGADVVGKVDPTVRLRSAHEAGVTV